MEAPNSNYEKFFEKFTKLDDTPVQEWDKTLVLAYFCKRYKEKYNEDFKFKFDKPQPSKCFEVFVINKLSINVSSNPEVLKYYIDFMFETKIKKAKRKITSVNTLYDEEFINVFKTKVMKGSNDIRIDRTTSLPKYVLDVVKTINENILTYGDLAFIMSAGGDQAESIKKNLPQFNFNDLSRVV